MWMPPIARRNIGEVMEGRHLSNDDRGSGRNSAGIFPGRSLELLGVDRRGGLSGRKITGKPFEEFLQERIFDPLGMRDTGFFVPLTRRTGFAACYAADGKGGITLHDDPATSPFLKAPSLKSGGGGLCSTAADYLSFCRALLNGGELGGVRLIGPKTLALMTPIICRAGATSPKCRNRCSPRRPMPASDLVSASRSPWIPAQTLLPGSRGEYAWGGAATTSFWIDPAEELIAIFMTQVLPSSAYPVRRELRTMVYSAITDSNL